MTLPHNPFKPTAGSTPPVLVGRQADIDDLKGDLLDGPGAPGRITIFTGARGVGKTVMLNEVEDLALSLGWRTITETALPGLTGRLEEHLAFLDADLSPRAKRRVKGVTLPAGLGAVETDLTPDLEVGFRRRLTAVVDLLADQDSGLLITVDEVHSTARDDLRVVGAVVQHLVREQKQIALVMAGLPSAVSGLLSDNVLTFLRRADRRTLRDVDVDEVQDAIVATLTGSGRQITDTAAAIAAEGTRGYPFLIQLVGYHLWRATDEALIDEGDAEQAVVAARRRLGSLVHETALNDLSDVDKTFLMAMSHDDGPSKMADLCQRMNVVPQYANTYKQRLIEAGMINSAGWGKVDYAMPYLRDFLREHGASLGLADSAQTTEGE